MRRTIDEREQFLGRLANAGFSPTNPRGLHAHEQFASGHDANECFDAAVAAEREVRTQWASRVLDPWCAAHGLTRLQALSVAFQDGPHRASYPVPAPLTLDDVRSLPGETCAFARDLKRELDNEAAARPNLGVAMASRYPPREGDAIDLTGPLYDNEGAQHRLISLSSREIVTALGTGFHVVWDRETLQARGEEPEVKLRSTPLSTEEQHAIDDANLAILRGEPSWIAVGPAALDETLLAFATWLSEGHMHDYPASRRDLQEDVHALKDTIESSKDAPAIRARLLPVADRLARALSEVSSFEPAWRESSQAQGLLAEIIFTLDAIPGPSAVEAQDEEQAAEIEGERP